ncbi:RHS repeat-associated core domain-containing protein [Geoalkalibacter ferrihydriticus]|uniref:RHS repeat-associated core domain-containing protein n=1 Tax=Geoalkalibacter ferrihydriticus TaxID=392333 RepID=A0A1G9SEW3_9BACT|nr:RHS repeat-associated core domain-containing protein [Geoalkalibacter ferrihydriticus]
MQFIFYFSRLLWSDPISNHNRARYYDPMEGRFISRDPIGLGGGDYNVYAYVKNNPINYIDPEGEKFLLIAGGITGSLIILNEAKKALDKFFDDAYRARDETRDMANCFQNDDIEGFVDAYQNRGRAVVEAGLSGAEIPMIVPGTTGSGLVPVKPIEWILGGGTTAIGGAVNK